MSSSECNLLEWVRKSAIHLDSLDWRQARFSTFDSLDPLLQGKRIVFLGEPDPYIHEKYEFQLMLIRQLVHRGYTHVARQMGRSDGLRINHYIQSGDSTHLDRIAGYGYRGDVRADRVDLPEGYLEDRDPERARRYKAEELRFVRGLKEIRDEMMMHGRQPLRFSGFDIDMIPGGGYADILSVIEGASPLFSPAVSKDPVVGKIIQTLKRMPFESLEAETNRLEAAIQLIGANEDHLERVLGEEMFRKVFHSASTLLESFEFIKVAYQKPSVDQLISAYQRRESSTMFREIWELIATLKPHEKVIVLGHTMHLSKDYRFVHIGQKGPTRLRMWPSVGTEINQALPGAVFSIWMHYDHGFNSDPKCGMPECEIRSRPDTLEHLLAKAGSAFFLPLDMNNKGADYLKEDLNFVINGAYGSGVLSKQADAIFFVREVSALSE